MKRWSMWVLIVVGLALVSGGAQAGGRKKRRAKKNETPASAVIAKSMGDLKWGMTKDQVVKQLLDGIKKEYRPRIAKTRDAVVEDRLRHEAKQKMNAIRKSYVEFDGRSTGWDASFLKNEFTHNNGESMLVMRDGNSQNFYFFMNGQLWKWYKAFDASTFGGHGFKGFSRIVQGKFGKGKVVKGGKQGPGNSSQWVEWQDKKTGLKAVDQTDFYGFYSLVFEDKETAAELASLRRNQPERGRKRHALVESVTSGDSFEPDEAPDIADRISGKNRARYDEPEDRGGRGASRSAKRGASRSSERARTAEELIGDDDPLKGL